MTDADSHSPAPRYVDLDIVRADLRRAEEVAAKAVRERDELRAFLQRLERYMAPQGAAEASGQKLPLVQELALILEKAGRPMQTDEILAALQARGRRLRGQKPAANISSVMSRNSERFEFVRKRGWTLTQPVPTLEDLIKPLVTAKG
jgi:hypothetical protein